MTATILTLPNEFPLVFAFRVMLTITILALMIWMSSALYKKGIVDKVQRNTMMILSSYVMLMLYHTVIGRYSQTYYRYDGEIFSVFKSLAESFTMAEFLHLTVTGLTQRPWQ